MVNCKCKGEAGKSPKRKKDSKLYFPGMCNTFKDVIVPRRQWRIATARCRRDGREANSSDVGFGPCAANLIRLNGLFSVLVRSLLLTTWNTTSTVSIPLCCCNGLLMETVWGTFLRITVSKILRIAIQYIDRNLTRYVR